MNITPSTIYWITRLDGFKELTILFIILGMFSIAGLICWCGFYNETHPYKDNTSFNIKICFGIFFSIISIISGITARTLIPTTKEMCAIYVIPKIVNNEKINELGNETLNTALEWMKELKPNKILEHKTEK